MVLDLASILLTIWEPNSWEDDDHMCFSSKALENAVPRFRRFTNGNALLLEILVEMNDFKLPSFQPPPFRTNSSQ